MIFSSLNAKPCPYQYPTAIQAALDWIAGHDLAGMEAGTYKLQGDDVYINLQDFTTHPADEGTAERHDDYLDLQYVVSGVERMGYVPYTGLEPVFEDPEGKDITFYKELEREAFVDVHPGSYCIFFSNDIHRPGCAAGEPCAVRKAVATIRQSIL